MKIRVLIVEDEPPLQRSIKMAIESADPRYEVTGCAFNGQTALTLVQEQQPDVIITDIRMPVMDGIELISVLAGTYPDIQTVIISGHQEFEYAKQAMRFGVLHYLLKPLSVPELSQVLDRIADAFFDRSERLQRGYMERLLHSDAPEEPPIRLPAHNEYFVFVLCAGPFPTFPMDNLLRARLFWDDDSRISAIRAAALPGSTVRVFDGGSSAEKIAILALSEPLGLEGRDRFLERLDVLFTPASLPITIAASTPVLDIRSIGHVSQMLRALLNSKTIIGQSQMLLQPNRHQPPGAKHSDKKSFVLDSAAENRILLLLKQQKADQLRAELKGHLNRLHEENTPQIGVESVLKRLVAICRQSVGSSSGAAPSTLDLDLATDEAISNSFNYEELLQHMWYIFEDLMWVRRHGPEENVRVPELLVKVDEFIQRHLNESLSNADLAEKFGFAPTYLSKLFRNYKGLSPTEYMIHLRMEKAKQMMKDDPSVSSKEVALTIGYSDPLYFSKIFKKSTGVWPTEYKTLL